MTTLQLGEIVLGQRRDKLTNLNSSQETYLENSREAYGSQGEKTVKK